LRARKDADQQTAPAERPGGREIAKNDNSRAPTVATKAREQLADELCCEIEKAAGVPSETAYRMASQMAYALVWPKPKGEAEILIKTITALAEYKPRNAIEASLAAQMTATGEAGLMFMHRATRPDQTAEGVDLNVARATRLMRLHLAQIEAMQKLKGTACQQKVTVEHVHVHEGGQAIVGAVAAGVGDEKRKP
jgi:hypothetical protein